MRDRHIVIALALLVATVASGRAQPAATAQSRWSAWLGCWQLLEERVREDADTESAAPQLVLAQGAVVCVSPADRPDAVRLTTTVESQSTLEETITADGQQHPLQEPGCEGTQRAEWSANGRRLFGRAELTCGNTQRTVSGMSMIDAARLWTDVQVVAEGERETIRVRRYRRAPDQAQAAAGRPKPELSRSLGTMAHQAATLTIEEVKEVAQKLPLSALEAVLLETGASFPLNSKRLVELDDAGVPDRIIDLMVALSFPDRFVIERRTSSGSGGSGGFGPLDYGFAYGSMYDWPYYYAPFGYSTWNRYDTYYFGSPGYVVVDARPAGPQASGDGRVVDGQGYTRVGTREPQAVASSGGTGGNSGGAGVHGGSGGSSGGTVTSGGYSGGGGDGGRTAVDRPPGGF